MARQELPNNHLLRRLPAAEYKKLAPDLEAVTLEFKEPLYEQDGLIKHVDFVTSGVVSLITIAEGGAQLETGTVGREGFVGVPLLLGAPRAGGRAICQIEGSAVRISAARFRSALDQSEPLRRTLLLYANYLLTMTAQTAACNREHDVEARMSRWLLMSRDRVDSDTFPLTQEFLGQMLGVRRSAVNIAGRKLQEAGMIRYSRGKVTIVDRRELEQNACECYAHVARELTRTFGER